MLNVFAFLIEKFLRMIHRVFYFDNKYFAKRAKIVGSHIRKNFADNNIQSKVPHHCIKYNIHVSVIIKIIKCLIFFYSLLFLF